MQAHPYPICHALLSLRSHRDESRPGRMIDTYTKPHKVTVEFRNKDVPEATLFKGDKPWKKVGAGGKAVADVTVGEVWSARVPDTRDGGFATLKEWRIMREDPFQIIDIAADA